MTYSLLENAPPDHFSDEFLQYLKDNNVVVAENSAWLLIRNAKYHMQDGNKQWFTAFLKENADAQFSGLRPDELVKLQLLYTVHCKGWMVVIKRDSDRSVRRLHCHFVE